MRFTTDLMQVQHPVSRIDIISVLTGDGRREIPLMKGFSHLFDGASKIVFFPKTPISRKTGLSCLEAFKIVASKYNVTNGLCLIDKEFVVGRDPSREVQNMLQNVGIQVRSVDLISSDEDMCVTVNCSLGSRVILANVVFFGKVKCVEENISKLIKYVYGDTVPPRKRRIDRYLKGKRLGLCDFILKSGKRNVKRAFPSLSYAFSYFENPIS